MGRPSKLTPALRETICAMLRQGNYVETAAAAAGISKNTLYDWLRRGSRETGAQNPFVQFSDAIKKALAEGEIRDVRAIDEESSWQAHAWRLERRFPQRWGQKARQEDDESADASPAQSLLDAIRARGRDDWEDPDDSEGDDHG